MEDFYGEKNSRNRKKMLTVFLKSFITFFNFWKPKTFGRKSIKKFFEIEQKFHNLFRHL